MGCSAVPVDFLSHDQVIAYERFVGDLSRAELEGFFLLDATALDLIAHSAGLTTGWGLGSRSGPWRYPGRFLTEDPLDVRWSAVEYVSGQLEIADPSVVKRYTERRGRHSRGAASWSRGSWSSAPCDPRSSRRRRNRQGARCSAGRGH
ncbi:MAG TPA: DUF4158 domain-containing protein [Actinomycetota bacterium]